MHSWKKINQDKTRKNWDKKRKKDTYWNLSHQAKKNVPVKLTENESFSFFPPLLKVNSYSVISYFATASEKADSSWFCPSIAWRSTFSVSVPVVPLSFCNSKIIRYLNSCKHTPKASKATGRWQIFKSLRFTISFMSTSIWRKTCITTNLKSKDLLEQWLLDSR